MIKGLLGSRRLLIGLLTVAMLGGITIAQRTEVRAPVATLRRSSPRRPGTMSTGSGWRSSPNAIIPAPRWTLRTRGRKPCVNT